MNSAAPKTEVAIEFQSRIRETKGQLRRAIGDVKGAFAEAEEAMRREVAAVVRDRDSGIACVWPIIDFHDIVAGSVTGDTVQAIKCRGCAVVRATFPRAQAEAWNADLGAYLENNHFFDAYRYIDDGVFSGLAAQKPSIFPIYWSRPQLQARQHENMMAVRTFLNGFWKHESEGKTWFDPKRDTGYPDRVRRREPGTSSKGLSAHTDSGSVERWLLPAYQRVFRHVFSGDWPSYDPWDGAYRTEVSEYPSTVMCSAFRSFQGWTALSDMQPTEGVLTVAPIPTAMGYLLLRALQDDVAADDLCGAINGQALPITERWHSVLFPAFSRIPPVEPGDTVWWHGDLIHAVEPVANQKGWGNVMYIPATPYCDKNADYAKACGQAFRQGNSPGDFASEDYEVNWSGRGQSDDLNHTGRRQLGFDPW
jgi:Protein of unknown function (DUF1479)